MSTAASVLILIGVLAFAVVRPWGLPEAASAVPGAGLVVALGLVSWPAVERELVALGPTVAFLAAVLVLVHLAEEEGVFRYAGTLAGRVSHGSPSRLLAAVFAVAAVVTALLSLDATVGAADPGGTGDRDRGRRPGQTASVRLYPPGQLGVAAAAGVQPDEPAGVHRERADLRPLRGADGGAGGSR